MSLRIVAFCGPKGSGKDESAKFLLARNTVVHADLFRHLNFAEPLKATCGIMFGLTYKEMYEPAYKEIVLDRWPYKTPRELLQTTARLFRTMFAPDIFVQAWDRRVRTIDADCIVVTDLRHEEEYVKLRNLGAKIIYVYNPLVEDQRLKGIAAGDPLWVDPSEAYCEFLMQAADRVVHNDGQSLNNLYTNIQTAFTELFGDWNAWDAKSLEVTKGLNL